MNMIVDVVAWIIVVVIFFLVYRWITRGRDSWR
jgi:hypothetical protein